MILFLKLIIMFISIFNQRKNIFLGFVLFISSACFAQENNSSSSVFVAMPYLQIGNHPSTQSMQILWHTANVNADWVVEYKNALSDKWLKSVDQTYTTVAVKGTAPHRVYHASLKDLIPGSKFTYRISKDGKIVFTTQAQAIKSAEQSYRFIAFGDIGAETKDQKKLASIAFYSRPDFVVVPGDIVYEYGLVSEYTKKFWPIYNANNPDSNGAPIMRSVPFITAVGNHDADTRDLDRLPDALAYYMFWDQPLNGPIGKEGGAFVPVLKGSDENKKAFFNAAGNTYPTMANYSFDYGNTHWTVIDSDTYVDWTDSTLTDWVKNDLANSKNATWHFVMYHHPGFSSSKDHFEQQQMRLLAPVFEAGNVDVVFNGHVHNYQRSFPLKFAPEKKGTLLVGGKDNKTVRGRVVPGAWTLDKTFDGKTNTTANGVIYIVTGAGGQELYNPEQEKDEDSWQKFTTKFISTVHSLTVADVNGKTLTIRQISADGKELDSFKVTKK